MSGMTLTTLMVHNANGRDRFPLMRNHHTINRPNSKSHTGEHISGKASGAAVDSHILDMCGEGITQVAIANH